MGINAETPTQTGASVPTRPPTVGRTPRLHSFHDLNIGAKLAIGFMTMALLIITLVALMFGASRLATRDISLTKDLRVPAALASDRAQANLLRMQAAVRGYLVLGDLAYIDEYNNAKQAFIKNLDELNALSALGSSPADTRRVALLQSTFAAWSPIPATLFELHKNPIENQPAMRIENLDYRPASEAWNATLSQLIQQQEARSLSAANRALLSDMVDLQSTFHAMNTNLRAYAITGDPGFQFGYSDNLGKNSELFSNLVAARDLLTGEQSALLDELAASRTELLEVPLNIFAAQRSERRVEALYLFSTEVEPLANEMLTLLDEITGAQRGYLEQDLARSRLSLSRMQWLALVGGLLAVTLGVVMGLFFRNLIAGPIRRLDNTAKRIEGGDLAARALIESSDEIGRLAQTFNAMTGRLWQTISDFKELANENRQLFEESQQRAVELAVARDAAEEANRAKGRFLANVSHELRTPLNAILGYTQKLKRSGELQPDQTLAAAVIYENSIHLLALINDLLDLSKIEADKLILQPNFFDFPRFIHNLCAIFRLRADEKEDLQFDLVLLTELPIQVRADEKRLRQILMNLLGNAIKFTDAGEITLKLGATPQPATTIDEGKLARLQIEVSDTGVGMNEEQLARIFLPFEQAGDPSRQAQGIGLGLAITRDLVAAMGGELTVRSEPDRGSTFNVTLTLPVIWGTETPTADKNAFHMEPDSPLRPREVESGADKSPITPPAGEDLAVLFDLAMKGELRSLVSYVNEMADQDSEMEAFANQMQTLANAYDDETLRQLLADAIALGAQSAEG